MIKDILLFLLGIENLEKKDQYIDEEDSSWCVRPWGKYKVISEGSDFVVKHLIVNPGGQTSLQSHTGREEYWTVASGVATIEFGDSIDNIYLVSKAEGESFNIKLRQIHRIKNNEENELHIIEVWKGNHLCEDDITRYQDLYGRK